MTALSEMFYFVKYWLRPLKSRLATGGLVTAVQFFDITVPHCGAAGAVPIPSDGIGARVTKRAHASVCAPQLL